MRFQLLGPLAVDADGTDVTPRPAQQRRLIAALADASPRSVSVDQLAEVLWGGPPPNGNALAVLVSKTRRSIGIDITRDEHGYALRLGPGDDTDVAEFERLVAEARVLAEDGRPAEAIPFYEAALALVRGAPLADLDDVAAAARLAGRVAAARAAGIESKLESGDQHHLPHLEADLDAALADNPLDEHLWALLMTVQYRQGRQGEALRTFQRARDRLAGELGLEPGPELRKVERQVLAQDAALDGRARRRRRPPLPARLTSLIGRDDLLAALAAATAGNRLTTLLGPGGAGKTSLAIELARARGDRAVFVTLAGVGDPDDVPAAVAAGLGVATPDNPLGGASVGTPIDRLVDAIAGEPLLLVLDNCEHIVDAAAAMVHDLLQACPSLAVLATSREALGVPGEVPYHVPPLSPGDAVTLFVERAAAAVPGATFSPDDLALIDAICTRLDHLPLAIELAAARTSSLDLQQMSERLADRFTLLDVGPRTVDERQRTLRAVVDWSYDLLDESERITFRRLAAFNGGATMASAEALVAGDDVPAAQVGTIVQRLVDKSLLVVDRRPATHRYWMLQTLREYAVSKLRESGEVEAVHARHAKHFRTLVAGARRGLMGSGQREWLELLTVERDNLRSAIDTAVARGDSDTAVTVGAATGWYFYMVGQTELGAAMLRDALSTPGRADPSERAIALAIHAWLTSNTAGLDAHEASVDALAALADVDDPWVEAFVRMTWIMVQFFAGDIAAVRRMMGSAAAATSAAASPWLDGLLVLIRGELAQFEGDAPAAERHFRAAVELWEMVGDHFALSIALTEAAEIAEMRGDYDQATAMLRRSLALGEFVGFSGHPLATLTRLANVEILRGNLDTAQRLHLSVLDDVRDASLPWVQSMAGVGLASIARRRGELEEAEARVARAWELAAQRAVPLMRAVVLVARTYTADLAGNYDEALDAARGAVAIVRPLRAPRQVAYALEAAGAALALAPGSGGEHVLGARLLGQADCLRRRSGGPLAAGERFDVARAERRLIAALGDEGWRAAFAAGAADDVDTLIDEVLSAGVAGR